MPAAGDRSSRPPLEELLAQRILILDGAMGTMIHKRNPTEADYRGKRFANHPVDLKNHADVMVLTQPEWIADIHAQYFAAGADIVETNTFGATPLMMAEFELTEITHELNVAAAELARRVADDFTRRQPHKPRYVAGSIGPTKFQLSFNADKPGHRAVTFDQMVESYAAQVRGLLDGGVDLLLPETSFDTLNMKSCLYAIEKVFDEGGRRVPVIVSGTIFTGGRTLTGHEHRAIRWHRGGRLLAMGEPAADAGTGSRGPRQEAERQTLLHGNLQRGKRHSDVSRNPRRSPERSATAAARPHRELDRSRPASQARARPRHPSWA